MCAWRMVHAVLARPARPTLKPDKLRDHPRAIEQVDPTRIHQRQEREVKLAAVQLGRADTRPHAS